MKCKIDVAGRANERGIGKPDEDMVRTDESSGLFLVLDGITRVHDEYDGSGRSAACDVNRIFAEAVFGRAELARSARSSAELDTALRTMLLEANAGLVPYRRTRPLAQWRYYPGTVGILAALRDDRLFCVWAGDCIGLLVRGAERRVVARQQTAESKRLGYGKDRLYAEVCNHPGHPCAYGIFNGDAEVADLLESSETRLEAGDVVLLSTDGLAGYLQNAPVSELRDFPPARMLDASIPYDRPPYGTYADDKAVVKMAFG